MISSFCLSFSFIVVANIGHFVTGEPLTGTTVAGAEPRILPTCRIPEISRVQFNADNSLSLVSSHVWLRHLLKNGSEFCHTAFIEAETGRVVNTPEKGLRLRLEIGETVFWHGYNTYTGYKLLAIDEGVCIFERTSYDRHTTLLTCVVAVRPY